MNRREDLELLRVVLCASVILQRGRSEDARSAPRTALRRLGPAAVKQRAVFLLDVASSYLGAAPDVDEACHLAVDAAGALAMAGYATASTRLHEVRALLGPWEPTSAVVDLDERLGALTA